VLRILQQHQISSPVIEWGVQQEPKAIEEYQKHQQRFGHQELTVCPVGFLVCQSETHPFLGTSHNGVVYDPLNTPHPFGFMEIKCLYSHRHHTPLEACSDPKFCCELRTASSENPSIVLKHNHPYYCQLQGQMAVGNKPWCDFVIYTPKGMNIERVR